MHSSFAKSVNRTLQRAESLSGGRDPPDSEELQNASKECRLSVPLDCETVYETRTVWSGGQQSALTHLGDLAVSKDTIIYCIGQRVRQ